MLCVNPQLVVGPGNFLWFSLLSIKFFHHKATCLTWCQVFALGLMSFPSSRFRKSVLELGFHPMCGRSPRAPGDKQLRKFRKLPKKITSLLFFSLLTHFSHGVSLKSAILMMQHFLMISTGKACFSAVIIWNISIIWGFFQLKNCEISNSIGIYSARLPRLNLSYQSDWQFVISQAGLLV